MIDDHEKNNKHIHFDLPIAYNTIQIAEIRTPRDVFIRKKSIFLFSRDKK